MTEMHLELDAQGRKYLDKFRRIALALPEVVETETFGHPWFRAGGAQGKMISVFGAEDGHYVVSFKVAKAEMDLFLADPRYSKTPYVGKHGWISLKLDQKKPDWDEVREMLVTSYRNNAPKKLVAKLDA